MAFTLVDCNETNVKIFKIELIQTQFVRHLYL